jgi:ADP-heptose:LPS heptosyltransferase/lauroyl/myristoyl acyltransferase
MSPSDDGLMIKSWVMSEGARRRTSFYFNRASDTFHGFSRRKSKPNPARVLTFAIKSTGWLTAHTPEPLLRAFSVVLGDLIYFAVRRRRRLVLSNLHHAFPEKTAVWRHAIARASCRRMIETAFLSLATPFLSEARLRRMIAASPELLACFAEHRAAPAATLICSPHIAYWEAQTSMALVVPGEFPEFGTIFRPLDNSSADAFVKRSRERFGMRLLSRREGFAEALKILRRRGFVGVLFDQNAGLLGALTTLFGRVCSTTELPGLMAEKFDARVYGIFPRRLGFWRVEIGVQRIAGPSTSDAVTIALNRWLENLLRGDDNLCASWLWVHDRWRNQDMPATRLRLEAKRNRLPTEQNLGTLPRRTRLWIRLPNWLGDVVMALPLLRALRASRPDAEITLVARQQFLPLLADWPVADRLHALPPRGAGYFFHFWKLRAEFPDVWLLFTNSARGDLEARLTCCRQRFGILRPGKSRPLLSHAYRVPPDFDEPAHHQLELWENFLRHFGLSGAIDRTPLSTLNPQLSTHPPIGLICGSENTPAKRWPVTHWRALIESLPQENFVLLGTTNDAPNTVAVAAGFGPRVEDLAGKTTLLEFAARLRTVRLLVTNDTGGMHLANALGVPLLVLFGPTNPTRTGPVFAAPVKILRSSTNSLDDLQPDAVADALRELLHTPPS